MKKSKVSVAIITLLAVVLALALAGCGDSSNGSGTGSEKQKDYFEIKTEAGNLRYPDQWEDVSKVDVSTKDGVTSVVFRGKEKGKTFTLFTVQIGVKGDNAVGTIKDKKGKERDVFMKTSDLEVLTKGKILSKAAKRRLYTMQEDINFVIDNLR